MNTSAQPAKVCIEYKPWNFKAKLCWIQCTSSDSFQSITPQCNAALVNVNVHQGKMSLQLSCISMLTTLEREFEPVELFKLFIPSQQIGTEASFIPACDGMLVLPKFWKMSHLTLCNCALYYSKHIFCLHLNAMHRCASGINMIISDWKPD